MLLLFVYSLWLKCERSQGFIFEKNTLPSKEPTLFPRNIGIFKILKDWHLKKKQREKEKKNLFKYSSIIDKEHRTTAFVSDGIRKVNVKLYFNSKFETLTSPISLNSSDEVDKLSPFQMNYRDKPKIVSYIHVASCYEIATFLTYVRRLSSDEFEVSHETN